MTGRRSGRSHKQVDYSKFAVELEDNDDDFADPTPPPPKRKKTEKTEGRKDRDKPVKASTSSEQQAGRRERLPLDEKLYERDLQAAMELSLRASQSEENLQDGKVSHAAVLHSTPLPQSDHQPLPTSAEMPGDLQTIMPSAIPRSGGVAPDNDIEFLGTVTNSDTEAKPPLTNRRAATSKRKTYVIDDDDDDDDNKSSGEENLSDSGSGSESDFSDADSDFDDGKSKSKKKGGKGKDKATHAKAKATTTAGRKSKNQLATKCDNKEMPGDSQIVMPSAIPRSGGVAPDNDIEFLGTVTKSDTEAKPPLTNRRAATSKRKTYVIDDDDDDDDNKSSGEENLSDSGSGSESDFNDADSDFDDGKSKSKKKGGKGKEKTTHAKAKATTIAGRKSKNQLAAKCDNKAAGSSRGAPRAATATASAGRGRAGGGGGGVSSMGGATLSPSSSPLIAVSRAPPGPHKAPAWTPPGRSDGGGSGSSASLKSPSSGLRLGLSRHARIKPLHPSLKVS